MSTIVSVATTKTIRSAVILRSQSLTKHKTAPAAFPNPQDQERIDPNPTLTYSLRDPDVTNRHTQNITAPTTASGNSTIGGGATASPSITEVASFTAPNGGVYGATLIDGTVQVAGYELTAGGPDGLVGGVRVSAASDGLVHEGSVASYVEVTAASTQPAMSTSTGDAGSTQSASSSGTDSSESATATDSESSTAASGSASETAQSTGGAAGGAVAKSQSAMAALAGIAGLLCVFG